MNLSKITVVRDSRWGWCFGVAVNGTLHSGGGYFTKWGACRAARKIRRTGQP